MIRLGVLVLSMLVAYEAAEAKIVEVPTMAECLKHADSDTLFVSDLDNTLVTPTQTLGGEEWYDYLVGKYTQQERQNGQSPANAERLAVVRALEEWVAVTRVTEVRPVEADAPRVLAEAQRNGMKAIALTARPENLKSETHLQLLSIGVNFLRNTVSQKIFHLPGVEPILYSSGVTFVGTQNSKGDALVKLLDKLRLQPKRLVFADNKERHLVAVEKALSGRHIDYIGCRLSAADHRLTDFNPEIAELQHRIFLRLLSDDAANLLRKSGLQR